MASALLYAEAKLGEILKVQTSHGGSLNYKGGAKQSLPEGISHKQSHFAQKLYENKELIERVIEEAREKRIRRKNQKIMRKIW